MFDYKHTEIIEYVKKFPTCSEKIQTSRLNKKKTTLWPLFMDGV